MSKTHKPNKMIDSSMKILIVHDDKDICELITAVAQKFGFNCKSTNTVDQFLTELNSEIKLVLLDLRMPKIDGIELLRILGRHKCKSKLILMSGVDDRILETTEALAVSLGLSVVGVLHKPFHILTLEQILMRNSNLDVSEGKELYVAATEREKNQLEFTVDELKLGLNREEFILYYQPQVDISHGRLVGLEALVRWKHPVHGIVFPDKFIHKMEDGGLIDQLGWLVARRGLNELRQFSSVSNKPLTLSINVSPYSLNDLKLPDKFNLLAKEYDITESGLFTQLSSALDVLTRLRMKKFKLSIDDFGSGYAMIQQLKHVPATELKIDKSLVQNLHNSSKVLIKKIIEMGHDLGMQVLAEGVENTDQLKFLRDNKCDLAQGYLFSRPIPIPELREWIKRYHL